jgi:hypothetical protein
VLRTLNTLGVSLDVEETLGPRAPAKKGSGKKTVDLVDQVLNITVIGLPTLYFSATFGISPSEGSGPQLRELQPQP